MAPPIPPITPPIAPPIAVPGPGPKNDPMNPPTAAPPFAPAPRELALRRIASKPYLPSIHLQPYYRERFGYSEGTFPVSEATSARSLALPFHTGLAAEDQERVVAALAAAAAG